MKAQTTHGLWLVIALSFGASPAALAQKPSEPCCNITAFDRRTGLVTGLEKATGRTFQFVATPAQRLTIRVGQKLWADFATQKVSVDGADPCCNMVNVTPGTTAAGQVRGQMNPGEPCCNISSINATTGLVTATEIATGRSFQFKVADRAVLATLTPGQKVWADFGTANVRIHAGEPCCDILSVTPATTAAGQVRGQVNPAQPCCEIRSINATTGVVTASETASGRVFHFNVADRALLATLTPGQKVWADFGAGKVRIHGVEPCCGIVAAPQRP